MNEMLRWIAVGVPSVVFAGDACAEMVQSPQLAGAVRQLAKAHRLQTVQFTDIANIGRMALLLRMLERCEALTRLVCSIEIFNDPAIQRLLERSRSLTKVGIVAEGVASFRYLSSLANAVTTAKHQVLVTIPNCDDATAQQLAAEMAHLPPVEWIDITLVNAEISSDTYVMLKQQCTRVGNSLVAGTIAPISLDRNECFDAANHFGYGDSVISDDAVDVSKYNVIRFQRPGAYPEPRARPAPLALAKPRVAVIAPPEEPTRRQRVRGAVASHAQKGPGEVAAEFARNNEPLAPPPPPAVTPPALLCANLACVNRTIDSSEIHIELVCSHGHETHVHKTCIAALELRQCDGGAGDYCPHDGCADGVVAERTLVRIDEHGGRHVKSNAAAAQAPVVKTPTAAGAPKTRTSKKEERRKKKAERQRAAAPPAVTAVEPAQPPPPTAPPTPQPPLVVDDSEHVRRLASGAVECVRATKAAGPTTLLVKIKKGKPVRQWRGNVGSSKQQQQPGATAALEPAPENIAAAPDANSAGRHGR
jgi:hypothetical protein